MGRGRDKKILMSDLPNMSPQERGAVLNLAKVRRVKIDGAAVVRSKGNVVYENPQMAGNYHEDKIK